MALTETRILQTQPTDTATFPISASQLKVKALTAIYHLSTIYPTVYANPQVMGVIDEFRQIPAETQLQWEPVRIERSPEQILENARTQARAFQLRNQRQNRDRLPSELYPLPPQPAFLTNPESRARLATQFGVIQRGSTEPPPKRAPVPRVRQAIYPERNSQIFEPTRTAEPSPQIRRYPTRGIPLQQFINNALYDKTRVFGSYNALNFVLGSYRLRLRLQDDGVRVQYGPEGIISMKDVKDIPLSESNTVALLRLLLTTKEGIMERLHNTNDQHKLSLAFEQLLYIDPIELRLQKIEEAYAEKRAAALSTRVKTAISKARELFAYKQPVLPRRVSSLQYAY